MSNPLPPAIARFIKVTIVIDIDGKEYAMTIENKRYVITDVFAHKPVDEGPAPTGHPYGLDFAAFMIEKLVL